MAALNPQDELQIQYEIHSSIDFVEEKLKTGKKDMRELYLGLLYSTEDHKVYPFAVMTFLINCIHNKAIKDTYRFVLNIYQKVNHLITKYRVREVVNK